MFFTRALHAKKTNANVRIVSHICKFFLNFNISFGRGSEGEFKEFREFREC